MCEEKKNSFPSVDRGFARPSCAAAVLHLCACGCVCVLCEREEKRRVRMMMMMMMGCAAPIYCNILYSIKNAPRSW